MYSFWLRKRNTIRIYGDWAPNRCSIFTYVWMADQNKVMWRTWRGFILKGADKLLGKEEALKWRGPWQNIKVYGTSSQFYRKEK